VGANRIIFGGNFTNPVGAPDLPLDREKNYRRNLLLKALEAMSIKISEPTIYNIKADKGGEVE
jgi:glycine reductase